MENQHREIKGYRELSQEEIDLMNLVKGQGEALELLIAIIETKDVDKRWLSIGRTHLQEGLMALTRAIAKPTFFALMLIALTACVTPYKEPSGKFIKTAQSEMRSMFGTNQSFARLERCDGPEKSVLFYTQGDFSNCVLLTKPEQDEWQHAYSRGSGPEIVGAAIMGGSIGAGAAVSGVNASAGASASATNTAIQTVTGGRPHRR